MISTEQATPHRDWLIEAANLRQKIDSGCYDDHPGTIPALLQRINDLQHLIAHTPAQNKDDILVQLHLLGNLAWNDLARRLSTNLLVGFRQLWDD